MKRLLSLLAISGMAACADAPTQASDLVTVSTVPASVLPTCNNNSIPLNGTDQQGLKKRYGCNSQILIHIGTLGGLNASTVASHLTSAVSSWNGALREDPTLGLPRFSVSTSGGITINIGGGSGTRYCGSTDPTNGLTITITKSCNGNSVTINELASLFTHEMGHALGFTGAQYHQLPVGVNDHCAMSLPSDLTQINSSPCQYEVDKLYYLYGVRTTGIPDANKHIITGVTTSFVPTPLAPNQVASVSINSLSASRGSPSLGAGLPVSDATYQWVSTNPNIATVGSSGSTVNITGVANGTTTIKVLVTNPGPHQLSTRYGEDGQNSFTITVQTPVPAAIAATQGNGQNGLAHQVLPVAPTVRVTTAQGNPAPGVSVTFSVQTGAGSVSPATVVTNSSGYASTNWTLGNVGSNSLRAQIAPAGITGNPVTFTATASVGPPATMTKIAGDNQTQLMSTPVAVLPIVRVTDAAGNPVNGVTVNWTVTVGDASVSPASSQTNANGEATVGNWITGSYWGINPLQASTGGTLALFTTNTVPFIPLNPPTNVTNASCSETVFGSKHYATYPITWTPGFQNLPASTFDVGESASSSSSGATVIFSGPLSQTSQDVGPYLINASAPPRYIFIRHSYNGSSTAWVPLATNPLQPSIGCLQ